MIKILLSGCMGRMGQNVSKLISQKADMKIASGVDLCADSSGDYPVYSSFSDVSEPVDILVDYSHHCLTQNIVGYCLSKNLPAVICTTGQTPDELDLIRDAAQRIPIFKSQNMSMGINVLSALCKKTAELLGENFDIEILEMHHNQKLDAPSGTAIMLYDALNSVLPEKATAVYDRHGKREKRTRNEIGIHSLRGGTVVGEHSVIFAGNNEMLTLSHSATSREVFALGTYKAAKFLVGKPAGLYCMDDMIRELLGE